jgi:hypothetical protein
MNLLLQELKPKTPRQAINTAIVVVALASAVAYPWGVDPALVGVGFVAVI